VHPASTGRYREMTYALQRACASLAYCDPPARTGRNNAPGIDGTSPQWAAWIERWHATSPLSPRVRATIRTIMTKAGRCLAAEHSQITEPGQWTRQTCAAWVAAVDRMAVGDYVQRHDHIQARAGQPILPCSEAHILGATRTFFGDLQEWEWIGRRFDPARALAVSRTVNALIGTDPRVIADDVWAELLWAGLNLEPADLPGNSAGTWYSMELIRAITFTLLFAGLRSDEIHRLRVGRIRWQRNGQHIASGQPWLHYDLGHGYCSYTFFEECPHRMVCAGCDFYTRKAQARPSCWKRAATCSGCSYPSRSPAMSMLPSKTGRLHRFRNSTYRTSYTFRTHQTRDVRTGETRLAAQTRPGSSTVGPEPPRPGR
jgi:hypothetical protein